MGCRTARYTPWWHKEDLWILTCWRFKAESPGTDAWVALSGALHMHRCTAERRQHKPTWGWIHPRELTQNASWDALPLKGMAGQTYVLTHCPWRCQQYCFHIFEVLPWNSETPESLGESSSQSVNSLVPRMLLRNCFPPFTFHVPVATRTRLKLVNSNWRSDMAFKMLGVTNRRGETERRCVKEECAVKGHKAYRQQPHSHCEIITLP